MPNFSQLRCLGSLVIDLDEVSSDDEQSSAVSSVTVLEDNEADFATIVDEDEDISEAETIPGNPDCNEVTNSDFVEVIDSDSSVEILQVNEAPMLLTPEQEKARMMSEERHGHWLRAEHRADRLRRIAEERNCESLEERRARRRSFREAVHGPDYDRKS